jgi:hypothetical protein
VPNDGKAGSVEGEHNVQALAAGHDDRQQHLRVDRREFAVGLRPNRLVNQTFADFEFLIVDNATFAPVIVNTDLFSATTTLAVIDGAALDAAALAASADAQVQGLLTLDPRFDLGVPGPLSPLSPVLDLGDAQITLAHDPPLCVAADLNGDCRYTDGLPDLGADEQ